MKKVLANKKAIALFVVPGLVLYTILVIVPVIWSLYYSLYSGSPGIKWEFVGLDNYVKLFQDKNFLSALAVNAKYISVVMIGQVYLVQILDIAIFDFLMSFYSFYLQLYQYKPQVYYKPIFPVKFLLLH